MAAPMAVPSYCVSGIIILVMILNGIVCDTTIDRQVPPTGRGYQHSRLSPCEQSSCYPATGNLLIGREDRLRASSTCGLKGKERFCIVSHLEERKKCFYCDSSAQPNPAKPNIINHRIENIVYTTFPGSRIQSWWQGENGKENVTIYLDLESEFHFTHLLMVFKSFRPAAMYIERSHDFGKTWRVYKYFAHKCNISFPHVMKGPPRKITDVVCEEKYSAVAPSSGGEVILRVLAPSLQHLYDDPYSEEVQSQLKVTNLRIHLIKLHTLGDDLLDNREEIQEKYYFAISEMIVRGSCSCYGHASRCLPREGVEPKQDMVHGQCECTHNTKGLNCEGCEDFFNDLPWKPAFGKKTNACKKCNCNNHAIRCHFDQNVFEETGNVSGGVCDDCQHNTKGRNCEYCVEGFYHEPSIDFSNPDACRPCNCNLGGSLDNGICIPTSDFKDDLEAGQCHCKKNVEGKKCDSCKRGFWNFDENNIDGCDACTCNTLGTLGNEGCDVITGDCTCKRFVVGKDCNQCLPQHWGLSDIQFGCKPCDCDIGGSLDNNCDVISGQCRCRPHLTGRRCDIPEQSYYAGHLDFLIYEAEFANCTGKQNCQVTIREPFRDGQESTWTGPGFMRAYENTQLVFDINNVKTSMDYDLVIRYEPQFPGQWDDIKVQIERNEKVDANGPCGNSRPEDDFKDAYIPSDSRNVIVVPPVCLESGKNYKVRIQFKHFGNQVETPSASILVDSIALIPRVENLPFFQGNQQNLNQLSEYERYRCKEQFLNVVKGEIPEICKKYDYNIGFYVFGGAFACDCDLTGSVSTLCSSLGGKCQCKPNVEGRRCDRCAPGTYGFGPEGCKSCDCNSVGALHNFCDANSGQCVCRPQTYGRECDQCQPGSWNYPNCQRCQCNGHAETCHSNTGACTDCQASTTGQNCERCKEGYYGDPRLGIDIACRPCPCPGTVESGHSYADRCLLDAETQDVVCECQVGYAGSRCDVCADNYFGNPEILGGSCQACNCSSNIDISQPGNCNPHTGECVNCLFNTEGFNCQICKAGFYGDASQHSCIGCVCDILGTDAKAGPCDRVNGQCPCLPNVIGQKCDECKPNHWKIASGTGCEPCDCDPVGSSSDQCNLFDGHCTCHPGFGGRRCNECQELHWGDPRLQCHPCECNPEGSATLQCHQQNGTCICMLGIGGARCDECARGYLGSAPQCSPCGECFDNWDEILNTLDDETKRVINAAKEIKRTGATGAYTQEFEAMEKKLEEIKQLLKNTKKSSVDLGELENSVQTYRTNLSGLSNKLTSVGKLVENTTQRIYLSNLALANLRNKTTLLEQSAQNLKDNATRLQESNIEGALNLTREALKNSLATQDAGAQIQGIVADAERQCKRTDNLVSRNTKSFMDGQQTNDDNLRLIENEIKNFEQEIPLLNQQVCDKRGDPCDPLCGGAGCGHCGGLSCEEGAVTKAEKALSFAKDAEKHIGEKEASAEELFRGISQVKQETIAAYNQTQTTYNLTSKTKNDFEEAVQRSTELADKLENFLNLQRATPAEIRNVATDAMSKSIQLKPEQITDIARKINDTIASRTDISSILADTSANLTLAKRYKTLADQAKDDAEKILKKAKSVVAMLNEADEAQNKALTAIDTANNNISSARKDLTQTASETREAQHKANETVAEVKKLQDKLKQLQTGFLKNVKDSDEVAEGVNDVQIELKEAQKKASLLRVAYKNATDNLEQRGHNFSLAHTRAQKTLSRASSLFFTTNAKLKELQDAEGAYNEQENTLVSLSIDLDNLNSDIANYLNNINKKSKYYRNCYN